MFTKKITLLAFIIWALLAGILTAGSYGSSGLHMGATRSIASRLTKLPSDGSTGEFSERPISQGFLNNFVVPPDNTPVIVEPTPTFIAATYIAKAKNTNVGNNHNSAWSYPPAFYDNIRAMIRSVFTTNPDEAVAIATCESSLDPGVHHLDFDGNWADGLFQLHPSDWHAYIHGDVHDPMVNILAAHAVWVHNGSTFHGLWACTG